MVKIVIQSIIKIAKTSSTDLRVAYIRTFNDNWINTVGRLIIERALKNTPIYNKCTKKATAMYIPLSTK